MREPPLELNIFSPFRCDRNITNPPTAVRWIKKFKIMEIWMLEMRLSTIVIVAVVCDTLRAIK